MTHKSKKEIMLFLVALTLTAFFPQVRLVSGAQIEGNPSVRSGLVNGLTENPWPELPVHQEGYQQMTHSEPTSLQTPAIQPADRQALNLGPDQFPEGINPLTGLPVQNPALLSLPPALISVTNFPISARPQAGLSFASYVFELFIGEGMTRYLALFYGDYPSVKVSPAGQSGLSIDQAAVGPIRSGRLPYQSLRKLYNGFLVMASASQEVRAQLSSSTMIYGSDNGDINSALIDVTKLQAIAQANATGKPQNLTGNLYSQEAPPGGKEASKLWVFYAFLNQIEWRYDSSVGAYLRYQDQADGSGEFYPSTDRLTGEQLAFENVVVLFAKHDVLNGARTLIDLDLFFTQNKAYLLRDGRVYPIYWNTASGDYEKETGLLRPIRFVDAGGKPFPLKSGQTWIEIVAETATMVELEPGTWKARFYAP